MVATRRTEKIKIGEQIFKLQSLVPADFLSSDGWPFQFFTITGEKPANQRKWIEDGGPKPKWLLEQEARVKKIMDQGVIDPKLTDEDLDALHANESVRNLLVGAIFAISYGLDLNASEPRELSRAHLEEIGIKARMLSRDPWEIVYGDDYLPEGLNPKRHDFNNMVLMVGFERDKKLAEQMR